MMKIKIIAIDKYLPTNRIESADLDLLAKGKVGRIEKNTGVQFRHHVSGKESVCEMGAIALQKALSRADLNPQDIDLLIFAGASFDYPVPHNSAIIKSKITNDEVNFNCFDVDSTCLSFMNALDLAHLYLEAGRYKRIAIVCSEIASKALSPNDEKTFGLFGDAAVAVLIESNETEGYHPAFVNFQNYPSGAFHAHVPIGGAINRGIDATSDDMGYNFKMRSNDLIRLTTKHIDGFVANMEHSVHCKIVDFDKIITHQTSKYGNEFMLKNFKLSRNQMVETLPLYGNCISASIPLGLEEFWNQNCHETDKKVLLFGTGAGLTLGAMVLEFN